MEEDHGITNRYVLSQPSRRTLLGWRVRPSQCTVLGMTTAFNPYRSLRFPAKVIEHAVGSYHWLSLSLRDVETILVQNRRSICAAK